MIKYFLISIFFISMLSCQPVSDARIIKSSANDQYEFYVGTYTQTKPIADRGSEGIYKFVMDKAGQLSRIGLVAKSNNPSFLTKTANGKYLLAVNEINSHNGVGTVESFAIHKDSLELISTQSSGGAHPCFVTTDSNGFVLAANYSGGNIGLLQINERGQFSELLDVLQHEGKGSHDRQDAPHAHSAWFRPDGKGIISVDLGTNELWFSKIEDQKFKAISPVKIQMAEKGGPRHLTFHPNGKYIYVVNELSSSVAVLALNENGSFVRIQDVSTLPDEFIEPNTSADIHLSNDGKYLYASNRGHNSLAIFKVSELDGTLFYLANESVRGNGPRNFAISPDDKFLIVANQLTDNIVSFQRDSKTGLLKFIDEIQAPTPVCLLF